ncbi:MAG: large-conductance mechanosensitive channel protein MscL [Bacteroidales bacterium]|jgi:large conductance mechanosensitive channel|nr:large-conductance mechanosensitive channel protein MscL [Bacteroidales bacterium]
MSKFFKEFKDFAMKGNVIDMAVGIIIGAAFGKIVTSLVSDIIMPLIGLLVGGINFQDWKWVLKPANPETGAAAVSLNYGIFLQTILDFLIVALCIFFVIRGINKAANVLKKPEKPAEPAASKVTEDILLLREIRDELKEGKA